MTRVYQDGIELNSEDLDLKDINIVKVERRHTKECDKKTIKVETDNFVLIGCRCQLKNIKTEEKVVKI